MRARARVITRALLTDPRLIADYVRLRRAARDPLPTTAAAPPSALSLTEALDRLREQAGGWSDGPAVESLRAGLPSRESGDHGLPGMTGDRALGELCYAVVRIAHPDSVIETGVAAGTTSAYILAALSDNDRGRLHSIDLPDPGHLVGEHVGERVPDALRSRWDYRWGSARRLLEGVLRETAGSARRVFVHDSDHHYAHMRWELETARAALSSGDWIVADDVGLSGAFGDFASALSPSYVRQLEKDGSVGVVQLP